MYRSRQTARGRQIFSRIGFVGCLSLGVSTLVLSQALAQQAQPAAQAPAAAVPAATGGGTASATVEDVVVSAPVETPTQAALKKVQETPVAATVVTQQQLEAAQINDLQGAQRLQPSLNIKFGNVRNIAINIRGFGAASSSATDAIFGGVPVYLNGVYQPFVGQSVFNIPDLTGIEVLKGPQGTSGGQDSTGGVVNITTAMPSFTQSQAYEFQYGRFNMFQEKGSLTGPVADSDWAAFRLSFFAKDQDGYILSTTDGNRYNGQHAKGGVAQLLLTPTQDLTVLLAANYSTVQQGCCISGYAGAITNYTNTGGAISNNYFTRAGKAGIFVPPAGQFQGTYTTPGYGWQNTSQDNYQVSAKVDYTANGYNFESVTAASAWDFHPHNGFSINPNAGFLVQGQGAQIDAKSVMQELKFSTPKGAPVEVTAGTFFLWDLLVDRSRSGNGANGSQAGAFYGGNASALVNSTALNYLAQTSYDNPSTTEIAPYIQGVWHATSDLDLTAGTRYSYNYKSSRFFQWIDNAQAIPDGVSVADVNAQRISNKGADTSWYASTHQGIVSYLGNATYKFNQDVFGYVTVSQGGRAGGPNPATGAVAYTTPHTIAAERVENYEVGLKSAWFDQRLTANLAVFMMVDHNYITYQASQISGINQTYLANAKRADSRGVELDLRAQPIDGLNLYGSLTYDDTYYGSYSTAACPLEITGQTNCNLTGSPLANTPRWTFVVGGEYSHTVGNLLQPYGIDKELVAYAGADFTWQSAYFSDTTDSVYTIIHPYGLLNLHSGIKFADDSYDVVVWAHNALNKHYFTQIAAPTSGGLITATVGDPVEVGATIRAKF